MIRLREWRGTGGLVVFCLWIALSSACGNSAAGDGGKSVNSTPDVTATPAPSSAKTVTIESPDGVKIVGSMFAPNKPNSPAVLMMHQWQNDRHSYDDLAAKMQSKGFAVLTIDGRGFGESTKKTDGAAVAAGRTDADVKGMLSDVDSAFTYLSKQPNVDPKRVGIIGASYASSLAIIYAADHPGVAAVALLSPGIDYFGNIPTEPAVKKYGNRPLLFIAAEDDKASADAVRQLDPGEAGSRKYPQHILQSGGHGTALLAGNAVQDLTDFFSEAFNSANMNVRS
ncbi:MAG: alpha/beta fold hydrolase [Acidobacteria bacterium]|nr:alpha/beta fold hydrolase [Acidobacteriota bacterium]